jgi:hypothetical protein
MTKKGIDSGIDPLPSLSRQITLCIRKPARALSPRKTYKLARVIAIGRPHTSPGMPVIYSCSQRVSPDICCPGIPMWFFEL